MIPEAASPPPSLGVPTLPVLISAEVRKLASRTSARVALGLLVLLGIGGPLLQLLVEQVIGRASAAGVGDGPEMPEMLATYAVSGVLQVRNFFLFRGLLIWVAAESFAGELVARTLREDLVRPVTRESLLVAKWAAVQAFVLASLVVPVVAAWLTLKVAVGVPSRPDNFVRRPVWSAAVVVTAEVALLVVVLVSLALPELPTR